MKCQLHFATKMFYLIVGWDVIESSKNLFFFLLFYLTQNVEKAISGNFVQKRSNGVYYGHKYLAHKRKKYKIKLISPSNLKHFGFEFKLYS